MNCRCGWDGVGDHLCHRCGTVLGAKRFYNTGNRFSLSGKQIKFTVRETWGCDDCWNSFKKKPGIVATQISE